jgi:hypothetical protein
LTVWHASRYGSTAAPTEKEKLVVERLTMRGDSTVLADATEHSVAVWVANYMSKSVRIANASVQGMWVGVASPFLYG